MTEAASPLTADLRPHLRAEWPPDGAIVVVRGGPSTVAKLTEHAKRTHDAYSLDGAPLWGVSVFCALDEAGPASLDQLLRRFSSYRAVHLPRVAQLRSSGFELLPSFRRPHYTVRMANDGPAEAERLLSALGPVEENLYHRKGRAEGR